MKRRTVVILFVLFLLAVGMSRNALIPSRFTGIWYASGSAEAYQFHEGIIRKTVEGHPVLDGAYGFTRDAITLFLTEDSSAVVTLHWARETGGDTLRTGPEGTVRFCRNREKALQLK